MYGIILFGKPGSGKSTIGRQLSNLYNYRYISSGDIARSLAESDSKIRELLNNGHMAPEHIMRSMIRHEITKCLYSNVGFILDGFPRYNYQDDYLTCMFPDMMMIRVLIDADDDVVMDRCAKRGREDVGSTAERLDYYHKNTEPLVDNVHIIVDTNGVDVDSITSMVHTLQKEVIKYVTNNS